MSVALGNVVIVAAFMFVAGFAGMRSVLNPNKIDPAPDVVLGTIITIGSGFIAMGVLYASAAPGTSDIHGVVGMAWVLGVLLASVIGVNE